MRITRTLAAASTVAALAAASFAGTAAASPTDTVLMNAGNVGFGTSFSGHKATTGGTLDWRQSGASDSPQLTGSLYVENSTDTYRVSIDHYPSLFDHSSVITRNGGEKMGSGGFLDVFPITLGGVTSTYTHVHINLQKKVAGSWTTVATDYQDL